MCFDSRSEGVIPRTDRSDGRLPADAVSVSATPHGSAAFKSSHCHDCNCLRRGASETFLSIWGVPPTVGESRIARYASDTAHADSCSDEASPGVIVRPHDKASEPFATTTNPG